MKKYTQKELNAIIKRHEMWLNDEEGGEYADLSNADLRGMDLGSANLRLAGLQDSNLYLACLAYANLEGADLRGTNLRGTTLCGADLLNAKLQGVNLQWADLRNVKFPKGFYQTTGAGCVGRCTTYDSLNDQVVCGCWNDDNGNHLESFKRRIENKYGKDGVTPDKQYYAQYQAVIAYFEAMKKAEEL